MPKQHTSL